MSITITKKWSSGMGPQQIIDAKKLNKDAEKALQTEYRGGQQFGCCLCGEPYKTHKSVPFDEIQKIQKWLAQGHCPYCKDGSFKYYKQLRKEGKHNKDIVHLFEIDSKIYRVIRQGR